jgi:hypothetical protein
MRTRDDPGDVDENRADDSVDVCRLGIHLRRGRAKLFASLSPIDLFQLARAVGSAATIPQPLQLRCHQRTLLLFGPLRVRLSFLLLLEKVVWLLPYRERLLRLGRTPALSSVNGSGIDVQVDNAAPKIGAATRTAFVIKSAAQC